MIYLIIIKESEMKKILLLLFFSLFQIMYPADQSCTIHNKQDDQKHLIRMIGVANNNSLSRIEKENILMRFIDDAPSNILDWIPNFFDVGSINNTDALLASGDCNEIASQNNTFKDMKDEIVQR